MPSKKKKYNARFPAGRIKKIMQTDEDVGKVAQAVPVIISRTLELFVESLLTKAMEITSAKNAKTLSPSHMKQCILSESRFDFLKDLVKSLPDVSACESEDGSGQASVSSIHLSSNSAGRRQQDASVRSYSTSSRLSTDSSILSPPPMSPPEASVSGASVDVVEASSVPVRPSVVTCTSTVETGAMADLSLLQPLPHYTPPAGGLKVDEDYDT